jgi:hypothetical protein
MRLVIALTLTLSTTLSIARPALAEEEAKPADAAEKFVPPDGWREKKRGKYTVYCRKEHEMGTRVPKETCYDEQGIRAMLASQQEEREKIDQLRRICSSQAACGSR